ncbi:MAG: glycosyltransferase family 39 protein, partial [Candidatus Limnocylindrales bacterium]
MTGPFSVAVAASFTVLGVGLAQARVVAILATAATVGLLALGLRSIVGRWPALVAGVAFGTSTLVLYYGRLAFLEPLEALFLVAALLLAVRGDERHRAAFGLLAGVALALAIGTKASGIVPAGGLVAGLGVVAVRNPRERRWLRGCLGGLALCGLG